MSAYSVNRMFWRFIKDMSEKAIHNSVLTLKELAKKWAIRVGADSVEKLNEIVEAGKGCCNCRFRIQCS